MSDKMIKVQVSGVRNSFKTIGALVDLIIDDEENVSTASRLVWFPKSNSTLEVVPYKRNYYGKCIDGERYFITSPQWFLDLNKVKYKIE